MALPEPVANLWHDLEVRADVLKEVEGLSQTQADWKPGEKDGSVGEIVHLFAELAASAEAPQVVWPERGRPIGPLIADMKSARERSRQSVDKLGTIDPRPLVFKHSRDRPVVRAVSGGRQRQNHPLTRRGAGNFCLDCPSTVTPSMRVGERLAPRVRTAHQRRRAPFGKLLRFRLRRSESE
jgi:hypothetical protein